jgi:hypothetical protein
VEGCQREFPCRVHGGRAGRFISTFLQIHSVVAECRGGSPRKSEARMSVLGKGNPEESSDAPTTSCPTLDSCVLSGA